MTKPELITLAKSTALEYGLDPALFCALVEQESGWYSYANRYESGFFRRYIKAMLPANKGDQPNFSPPKPRGNTSNATEAENRATSFGLCQVMGQVATRAWAAQRRSAHRTVRPVRRSVLEFGARRLKKAMDRKHGIARDALLDYNGGGEAKYPDLVLARMKNYA